MPCTKTPCTHNIIMNNSNSPNTASLRQSVKQGTRHGRTVSTTRSNMLTTMIHPLSNLPTPAASISGNDMRHSGSRGHMGAISTRTISREIPMRGLQDIREWASSVEAASSPSEDKGSESPMERLNLYECKNSPTAQEHLDAHSAHRPAASELDAAHEFAGRVEELTQTAVEKFHSRHMMQPRKRLLDTQSRNCRKRSRRSSRQDLAPARFTSDSEESDIVLVEHPVETAPRIWPCPFFVRDRSAHRKCLRYALLSVSDVRQHLCSVHLEPIHCSVCYETFTTVKLRDAHMQGQECLHKLPVIFDGLRDSQVHELERQGMAEDKIPGRQERQWVKIWRVVFSCTQPPPSPFSLSQQELSVYEFRRFWKKHGETIIAEVLASHRLQQYAIANEERSLEALYSLVADSAVDRLLLT